MSIRTVLAAACILTVASSIAAASSRAPCDNHSALSSIELHFADTLTFSSALDVRVNDQLISSAKPAGRVTTYNVPLRIRLPNDSITSIALDTDGWRLTAGRPSVATRGNACIARVDVSAAPGFRVNVTAYNLYAGAESLSMREYADTRSCVAYAKAHSLPKAGAGMPTHITEFKSLTQPVDYQFVWCAQQERAYAFPVVVRTPSKNSAGECKVDIAGDSILDLVGSARPAVDWRNPLVWLVVPRDSVPARITFRRIPC